VKRERKWGWTKIVKDKGKRQKKRESEREKKRQSEREK
jgi:hypothetical protein